jgi:hypothetical protein
VITCIHLRCLDPRRVVLVNRLAPDLVHFSGLPPDLALLILGDVSRQRRLDLDPVQRHVDVLLRQGSKVRVGLGVKSRLSGQGEVADAIGDISVDS